MSTAEPVQVVDRGRCWAGNALIIREPVENDPNLPYRVERTRFHFWLPDSVPDVMPGARIGETWNAIRVDNRPKIHRSFVEAIRFVFTHQIDVSLYQVESKTIPDATLRPVRRYGGLCASRRHVTENVTIADDVRITAGQYLWVVSQHADELEPGRWLIHDDANYYSINEIRQRGRMDTLPLILTTRTRHYV